jgi:uncharacterized damage-inducible protein DinB
MGHETDRMIERLRESMDRTLTELAELGTPDLYAGCSHPCARGAGDEQSVRRLVVNGIEHERMHAGQILGLRHDLGVHQDETARLLAEWLRERAALIGALIELPDEALDRRTAPDGWTIREVVEHTLYWERDSVGAGLHELATGERWRPDAGLDYGAPVPRRRENRAQRD